MSEQVWDVVINGNDKGGRANFKKVWQYRDRGLMKCLCKLSS
jgi:hypothetical protein